MELVDLRGWVISEILPMKNTEIENLVQQLAGVPLIIERLKKELAEIAKDDAKAKQDKFQEMDIIENTYEAAITKLRLLTLIKQSDIRSDKHEFESRLHLLPSHINDKLKQANLQIIDLAIYNTCSIGEVHNSYVQLMSASDIVTPGICNINHRKLGDNSDYYKQYQYFLLTGISLFECYLKIINKKTVITKYIPLSPTIRSGSMSLDIGSKSILCQLSCEVFKEGYYRLQNPKLIPPQTEIKPELFISTENRKNKAVRLVLHGVTLEKN